MASLVKEYSKEKLAGQIFTPFYIVEKMLDDIEFNSENILGKTILDPACGDGRFLLKIAERIINYSKPENLAENLANIYGWDIDAEAVNAAIDGLNMLINPYNIYVKWNIEVKNSLTDINARNDIFNSIDSIQKFDYIVGNPPYIRIQHLDLQNRTYIQQNFNFCKAGSTDIYIAFYELAINLLKKTGVCVYITPNTFFHTETAKELRKYFETNKNIVQITNYGHIQLFDNATTYSAVVVFNKKKNTKFLFQSAINKTTFKHRFIDLTELKGQKFWQLSLKKIEYKKGTRLGDLTNIHVGITTLADKIYIMPYEKEDNEYIYLQSKYNGVVKFEKEIIKPIIKVSTLKSIDKHIIEYILFPYKKINGKNIIIPENELKDNYPLTYQYLLSNKSILEKRDNGKPNSVSWFAFGRTQSLNTSFGKKILFSPMNLKPNFIYHENPETTFYSGYCIKYQGNNIKLLEQLNSKRMEEYIKISARDFRGGWKAYNKKIVQEFIIYS